MSNQGPSIVHYEVYALNDQRWILQARFRREEKEEALEEAKMVENNLGVCAKVVRETYYPGNNACEETLVYASERALRQRQSAAAQRRPAAPRVESWPDAMVPAAIDTPRQAKPPAGSMGIFFKLLLVVAISMAIAGGVTALVDNFLATLLAADARALLGFISFVVTFLASAVPLAMSVMDLRAARKPKPAKPVPFYEPVRPKEVPPPVVEVKVAEPEPPKPEPEPEEELEPDPPVEEAETEEPEETKAEEAEQATQEDETKKAEGRSLEALRMVMIRYLSSLLGQVKKVQPTLDAYNKFGVDLMLAGAIDVLGNHNNLDPKDRRIILKETIELMETKSETALAFADKYEDYLVERKYLSMVQAGRAAMEALLAGVEGPQEQVPKVFEAWNKPQAPLQAAPRIITVLFTDMVGSTNLTQAHGDQAGQDMVRRHNGIVRTALADYSGKEIKHTGDGIMASFTSSANGVEAAIAIQKACAAHTGRHPDQPLHLRIGINAGEPIEEEDDLFGTTVQLSARVCAQSGTDQILCTNVVRELSAGKGLKFDAKGDFELKGFKEPVALYEVLWVWDAAAAGDSLAAPPVVVTVSDNAKSEAASANKKPRGGKPPQPAAKQPESVIPSKARDLAGQ